MDPSNEINDADEIRKEPQTPHSVRATHAGDGPSQTPAMDQHTTPSDFQFSTPPSSGRPPVQPSEWTDKNNRRIEKMRGFLKQWKFGRNEPTLRTRNTTTNTGSELNIPSVQSALDHQERYDGRQEENNSPSGQGARGRQPGQVYDFVELVPGQLTDFRCKLCQKILGKKNATRFSKHSIEDFPKLLTPVKMGLARKTKSKSIGLPKSRREVGLAIERAKSSNSEDKEAAVEKDGSRDSIRGGEKRSANSSGSRQSKKRKGRTNKTYSEPPACHPEYVDRAMKATMELIVMAGLPFSIFASKKVEQSVFARYLNEINPVLATKHLPGSQVFSGKYLDQLYDMTRKRIKKSIARALDGGFGTVIFDGWDDVNSSPVVNVLLKTEPSVNTGNRVFFLKSVYTGSQRSGAEECVKIIEDVMVEYGGLGRISAITSDNTASCLNARKALTEKYSGLVGVNDQTHVADLLIEDVGKLPWIEEVLSKVSNISKEVHNHRKAKDWFKALLEEYNERLKDFDELDDDQNKFVRNETGGVSKLSSNRNPSEVFADIGEWRVRTAVMLRQRSNTRFASAEGVLDSLIRSIYVLRTLVSEPDFLSDLLKVRNPAQRQRRESDFISPIEDSHFEDAARDIHTVLLLLRRYLRVFDSDDARISEVYPFTQELENRLGELPLSPFLTGSRKDELMGVFRRRKEGPLGRAVRVRLLEDKHYAATLLNPNLAPSELQSALPRFRAHARRYAASQRVSNIDQWLGNLMFAHASQVSAWQTEKVSMEGQTSIRIYEGNPLIWCSFLHDKHRELGEFARRTLSCSPTSCAVERSFSAQKRLHSKERNRLSRDKVQKLLFCHWNIKSMRKMDTFNKYSFWESVSKVTGMFEDTYESRNCNNEQELRNQVVDEVSITDDVEGGYAAADLVHDQDSNAHDDLDNDDNIIPE